MPTTQAKIGRNAVAAAKDRDAIGMTAAEEGMTAAPVGTGRRKVKAGAISAGHAMAVAKARATSGAAIRAAVNSSARRHRNWN